VLRASYIAKEDFRLNVGRGKKEKAQND